MNTNDAYGMCRELNDGSLNYEDANCSLHPPDVIMTRNNAYGTSHVLDNGSSNYEDPSQMEPDVMTENSAYNVTTSEKLSSNEEPNKITENNVAEMVNNGNEDSGASYDGEMTS